MAGDAAPPDAAPEADAASLPPGVAIADYVIDRPLGGGGFGITYLARDSNLQLPVAIKEYFPSDLVTRGPDNAVHVRAGNAENQGQYDWGLERFLDEARALATFRHPNIVRVLRYFMDNGTAYIVMEYESGLPLKRWVPQNTPLSQQAVMSIVLPLLGGLEAVHASGFLHRDIKPDNIYVRADGTPVLLDFGAARRVTANKDMTNIVSPGYAPFEQYHSQGNQGPWTDIYSLGAVMYWMVTGRKPVESAARVKQDSMLPAISLAESGLFGESLLHAIDWALHPDEGQRPQTAKEFRTAIQGAEIPQPGHVDIELGQAEAPGAPSSTSATQKRNLVCTIMFLDLIGYSRRSVDDQVALKKLFNAMLAKALKVVPDDARIAIDTGDGAAICFMGDPEEALNAALLLRDLLVQRRVVQARIGLHMGPVRVIADINDRTNVIGDGINVAQRIMDFAQANQVLVSRAYYDVISRITDGTAELFQYMGQYEDKHGRLHEVYAASHKHDGTPTTKRQGPSTGHTQTKPAADAKPLAPEEVHDIEAELARYIGPLAKVLVKKAAPLASSVQALREALAPSIQESKTREAFIAGTNSQSHSNSVPVSGKRSASKPTSAPVSPNAGSKSVPSGSYSRIAPHPQLALEGDEAVAIEQHLSKFIGPMAKMLVRKEASRHPNFKDFIVAVAGNIDKAPDREVFLASVRKSLPRRY